MGWYAKLELRIRNSMFQHSPPVGFESVETVAIVRIIRCKWNSAVTKRDQMFDALGTCGSGLVEGETQARVVKSITEDHRRKPFIANHPGHVAMKGFRRWSSVIDLTTLA